MQEATAFILLVVALGAFWAFRQWRPNRLK
jgi:hypothetical protein